MDNAPERESFPCLNQRVDITGHHDPSEQAVALTIEVVQRILDQLADTGILQVTGAVPSIQVGFSACTTLLISLDVRIIDHRSNNVSRQSISQTKGDPLK